MGTVVSEAQWGVTICGRKRRRGLDGPKKKKKENPRESNVTEGFLNASIHRKRERNTKKGIRRKAIQEG